MIFNRRHRSILFLTLVITGCSLLLGAGLKESLGFLLLGIAFAWAVGSSTASKIYRGLKAAPGRAYPWFKLPIGIAFTGAIFAAVMLNTRANPVLAIAFMCSAGVILASVASIPSTKVYIQIPYFVLLAACYLVAIFGIVSTDLVEGNKYGGRIGELSVGGFLSFLLGYFWLSKGWKLIHQGISPSKPGELEPSKKSILAYVSLFLGMIVLTGWLGLLAWSASGNWQFSPESSTKVAGENPFYVFLFGALIASWPYHAWRTILKAEPNDRLVFLRRHRSVTTIVSMAFVLFISLSITYGIQNGNDRLATENILSIEKSILATATKIGDLKKRQMSTTAAYIETYSNIGELLPEFEKEIAQYSDALSEMKRIDKQRGLINIQRFYKSHNPQHEKVLDDLVTLLNKIDSLTKREVLTIEAMGTQPETTQVDYWQTYFKPLVSQETDLQNEGAEIEARRKATMR